MKITILKSWSNGGEEIEIDDPDTVGINIDGDYALTITVDKGDLILTSSMHNLDVYPEGIISRKERK